MIHIKKTLKMRVSEDCSRWLICGTRYPDANIFQSSHSMTVSQMPWHNSTQNLKRPVFGYNNWFVVLLHFRTLFESAHSFHSALEPVQSVRVFKQQTSHTGELTAPVQEAPECWDVRFFLMLCSKSPLYLNVCIVYIFETNVQKSLIVIEHKSKPCQNSCWHLIKIYS